MVAQYLQTQEGLFIIVTENNSVTAIPYNPANTDYQNIMKLVEDGELTIAPAEEPTE